MRTRETTSICHRSRNPVRCIWKSSEGREDLEQELGCTVRYFAFPNGQRERLNWLAFHTARDSGLLGICLAYGGSNLPGIDPFHLQ